MFWHGGLHEAQRPPFLHIERPLETGTERLEESELPIVIFGDSVSLARRPERPSGSRSNSATNSCALAIKLSSLASQSVFRLPAQLLKLMGERAPSFLRA